MDVSSINTHAMKTYGGAGVKFQTFITPALDRYEWIVSRSGCFTFAELLESKKLILNKLL
jgi:hypothetical protein